jgi:TfoX/Sxy family transcriptional regulator of competence genes
MFGGVGFMLNGNLIAGASPRGLLLRVGSERSAEALARPGARPMVMRGRALAGYVYVDPPALSAAAVRAWIELALSYVRALPPRAAKRRKTARSPGRKAPRAARAAASHRPAKPARQRPIRRRHVRVRARGK